MIHSHRGLPAVVTCFPTPAEIMRDTFPYIDPAVQLEAIRIQEHARIEITRALAHSDVTSRSVEALAMTASHVLPARHDLRGVSLSYDCTDEYYDGNRTTRHRTKFRGRIEGY